MDLQHEIAENRKTARAAVEVAGLGMAQKALVLAILDRHFEVQRELAERLDAIERATRGLCQPM